jgi:hypothetical protein
MMEKHYPDADGLYIGNKEGVIGLKMKLLYTFNIINLFKQIIY